MAKFKVTLEVDGEKYDMIVSFEGNPASVEFLKDGKQVKNYEKLPVEILSQIQQKEEHKKDNSADNKNDEAEDEEDVPDEEYGAFDTLYDLEDFIAEAEHSIECPELVKKLRPIIRRNFTKMDDISASLITAFTEADYEPALYALKIGLNDLSSLSSSVVADLGGVSNGESGEKTSSGFSSLFAFKNSGR